MRLSDFVSRPLSQVKDREMRDLIADSINLMDNSTRGLVAEVLVAQATGGSVTNHWDPWDVDLPDGTRVEVKTTGHIQAWPQSRPSAAIWDISPRASWVTTGAGYVWDPERKRRCDLYVFALHNGDDPIDRKEWIFRSVPTTELNATVGKQQRISVGSLDRQFSPERLTYDDLSQLVAGKP